MAEHRAFRRVPPEVSFPEAEAAVLRPLGRHRRLRPPPSRCGRPNRSSPSTTGPPSPPAARTTAPSSPACSRTSSPATGRCAAIGSCAASAGTRTACPSRWKCSRNWACRARSTSRAFGVERFNEAARARVAANTESWQAYTRRIGRWVDFEHDYKTLDLTFMESVWWVFRRLWDQGLIYRDFKVLPYSYGAATPLSNFEANMDYRDVEDPSLTVRLEVVAGRGPVQAGDYLLVWTTTPWTLPANLAVAVGADLRYVRIDAPSAGTTAATGSPPTWPAPTGPTTTCTPPPRPPAPRSSAPSYRPPFDYFPDQRDRGPSWSSPATMSHRRRHRPGAHGPGLRRGRLPRPPGGRHLRPGGPGRRRGRASPPPYPRSPACGSRKPTPCCSACSRSAGALVQSGRIVHSYPFCWRTGTPLIYKAIPTWFVRVEALRDRMVELNRGVHWVPSFVGERRFGNWLAQARDWAISRNRYWGSCLPVWECPAAATGSASARSRSCSPCPECASPTCTSTSSTGSPSPARSAASTMKRVPEVLDCWFESGSMPYAQHHYPFEDPRGLRPPLPGRLHRRGPRPDPRLVLHAAGAVHGALRPDPLPQLRGQRPDPRRGRPQDVQEPEELPRPLRPHGEHGGRRPAAPT